jgi:hypothetical protein
MARRGPSQREKPRRSEERMPLTLSVMMRTGQKYNRRTSRDRGLELTDFRQDFLAFALARDVLRFGEFVNEGGPADAVLLQCGIVQRRRKPAPTRTVLR